ncbi:USF1 [Cordylochernes scorpioides]|uniref:USF1 n=1 Tax=Cordylochernes scorpioides TaxID=51811 RepID=A0ABY6K5U9_9ARAC|nr:USF1 [Cordylochernes scorpioides]
MLFGWNQHCSCADGTVVSVENHPSLTHASLLDPNGIQYQFKSENGQIQQHEGDGTVAVTTGTALVSQQVAQAIISNNPYQSANGSASPTGGAENQFYVMMSPQEVLSQQGQGQRTLAPRTHQFSPKLEGARTMRDEKRRATHNEDVRLWCSGETEEGQDQQLDRKVIQDHPRLLHGQHQAGPGGHSLLLCNYIKVLAHLAPDCWSKSAVWGWQQSKGGILAKACDYIAELRAGCARVPELTKELEQAKLENQVLHQQCENIKTQNKLLLNLIQQHGISLENFEIS